MKLKRFALLLYCSAALLLYCSGADAATREWLAQAADVPQIDSITVAGTWAAGDTASVTIGNSTLTVTLGSDTTTTAQVATAIRNAINAPTIDASKVGSETRNAAGQLLGEFRDVEAVIDPANSAVVLVRSKVAGVPFYDVADVSAPYTLAASEATAGTGTLTAASVQVPTGKNWWTNTKNWSGGAVPVNDDTVVFRELVQGPKFGLPNGSLEVTFNVYRSFTGTIGLPLANSLGYTEYRQRYVRLDEAGTGTALTHIFGIGTGAGSPFIAVRHDSDTTLVTSATVYGTASVPAGSYALQLAIDNPVTTEGTVSVLSGSVDLSAQDGVAASWKNLNASGDARVLVVNQSPADAVVNQSGGTIDWLETTATAGARTLNISGGQFVGKEMMGAGAVTATVSDGALVWNATKTIATLIVSVTGVVNFEQEGAGRAVTITNCDLYKGASLLDGFGRGSYTNGIDYNRCADGDVTVLLGQHKRRSITAVP